MESTQALIRDDIFLSDTLLLSQDLLNDILDQIMHIQLVTANSPVSWNLLLTDLTQDIGRFVEVTSLLCRIALDNHRKLLLQVKESHISLLFILKAVNQSQQKQDLMALRELIKYELKDNLTQWKIDLIPQIKRHLKT